LTQKATLSATAVSGHLATEIEPTQLPAELPVGTTRFTAIASTAAATTAVTMSPALVMIDRCFRPAFDSPAPSTLESSAVVHPHQQHAASTPQVIQSYPARDSGGCFSCQSSIFSPSLTATTVPETSHLSTPMLLRPAVVDSPISLPASVVPSPTSSTQAGLPLHDALSRFRVYRRSAFSPSATLSSTPSDALGVVDGSQSNGTVSCRVIMCDVSTPTGAMASRMSFRRDTLSLSIAPDDEVRGLLETGSPMAAAADDDELGIADIRRKVHRWSVTQANTTKAIDSAISRFGIRSSEHYRKLLVVDDDMAVDVGKEISRRADSISDDDVETDEEWIDDSIDAPLPRDERYGCKPALADDTVIATVGTASLSTSIQRPSLDFDKMQVYMYLQLCVCVCMCVEPVVLVTNGLV